MDRTDEVWTNRVLTDEDREIIEALGITEDEMISMWEQEEASLEMD